MGLLCPEVESTARDVRLGSNTVFIHDMGVVQRVWGRSNVKQSKSGVLSKQEVISQCRSEAQRVSVKACFK